MYFKMFKVVLFLLLSCAVFAVTATTVMATENTVGSAEQNYYDAVEVLKGWSVGSPVSIEGYHSTICHSAEGYIVVALPQDLKILGLIRWTNGEIYNLYPTQPPQFQRPWFSNWPINFALSQGGKDWLNNFLEFTPRKFIWWDSKQVVISETFLQYGGTISVGMGVRSQIYNVFPRWYEEVATVTEWSRRIAVL